MELPDLLEQLDQMVHLVKLVPLDLREILVTKDHKYAMCMFMLTCLDTYAVYVS